MTRARVPVAIGVVAFGIAAVLLPLAGPFPLDLAAALRGDEPDRSILLRLRIARTLLGLFAGGALGLAGALFQSLLRDALATPYTLGVSGGASLGAVLALWLGWQQVAGLPAVWVMAGAGAAIVLAVVGGSALGAQQRGSYTLLLSGLAANSVCSALIIVIHSIAGPTQSFSITRWLIGSIDAPDLGVLVGFVAMILVISSVIVTRAREWNLLAVGIAWAATRGAPVERLTWGGYLAGSLLTAATVALTGPIGFVGLMVPHLIRERLGADHRVLMPCAFLAGGVLLAGCDALGRVLIPPAEVPAGALMAMVGGPYLVWVLRRRRSA